MMQNNKTLKYHNNTFKGMNSGGFMMLTFESKDREIKPYTKRIFRCPFYGFTVESKDGENYVMIDTEENQCAFAAIINLPQSSYCLKEMMGDKPNLSKCPLNTGENGKKIVESLEKIRVCPREFRPAKGKWDGWPLKIWMRHIDDTATEE